MECARSVLIASSSAVSAAVRRLTGCGRFPNGSVHSFAGGRRAPVSVMRRLAPSRDLTVIRRAREAPR